MQTQSYNMEVLAQDNAVLTSSKPAVISQLAHMTVIMNAIQVQSKTLASAQTKQARPKKKHYFWSCGRNYTHVSKTWSSKKALHQDYAYDKKIMNRSEKGRE